LRYTQRQTEQEVTLEPVRTAAASVVLLHGLGADGWDFVPIVEALALPDDLAVRFVFPHAPSRPVTINAGYEMRAWYDIRSFTPEGRADAEGLAQSARRVEAYLRTEIASGVPASSVVLAGFSQGGAVALTAGLRFPERLAGLLALSAYLPYPATLARERAAANLDLPVLMCHGRSDPVVPIEMGIEAREHLRALNYPVEWHDYPMQHEVCPAEVVDISRWLYARLGTSGLRR
jgi:phospholipase/carboxylesterase